MGSDAPPPFEGLITSRDQINLHLKLRKRNYHQFKILFEGATG